jgi:type 1 fimbria pilin
MGTVTVIGFSGVGSTSAARSFNIGVTCSGGDAGVTTRINAPLTDQTNPANQPSTLSLSNDSTAGGIGIQILNGSTVLGYGPDSATVGNPNQWSAGTTGNGSFNIPLTSRYVQTASTVTRNRKQYRDVHDELSIIGVPAAAWILQREQQVTCRNGANSRMIHERSLLFL